MRHLLLVLALAVAWSAEPPPLADSTRKLLDDAVAAAGKAREAYRQALAKEQDRLLSALQKEQERITRKGDLEAALAVKAEIDRLKAEGLEARLGGGDLLDDAQPAESTGWAAIVTDCPAAPTAADLEPNQVPERLRALVANASRLTVPKHDPKRYTVSCQRGGLLAVSTGAIAGNTTEVVEALTAAGFVAADGGQGRWWLLEAKAGMQFEIFDATRAALPIHLYAGRIQGAKPAPSRRDR
jgi:hypothetical protein